MSEDNSKKKSVFSGLIKGFKGGFKSNIERAKEKQARANSPIIDDATNEIFNRGRKKN